MFPWGTAASSVHHKFIISGFKHCTYLLHGCTKCMGVAHAAIGCMGGSWWLAAHVVAVAACRAG